MKTTELDRFVNKYVELTDFTNKIYIGYFCKIENGKFVINGIEDIATFKKGYVLVCSNGYYTLRPSHIKKIKMTNNEDKMFNELIRNVLSITIGDYCVTAYEDCFIGEWMANVDICKGEYLIRNYTLNKPIKNEKELREYAERAINEIEKNKNGN